MDADFFTKIINALDELSHSLQQAESWAPQKDVEMIKKIIMEEYKKEQKENVSN